MYLPAVAPPDANVGEGRVGRIARVVREVVREVRRAARRVLGWDILGVIWTLLGNEVEEGRWSDEIGYRRRQTRREVKRGFIEGNDHLTQILHWIFSILKTIKLRLLRLGPTVLDRLYILTSLYFL